MSTALALREAERLADLEVAIAQGLTTFVEVGAALSEIRESRLYRQSYATFLPPMGDTVSACNLEPIGSRPVPTSRNVLPGGYMLPATEPTQNGGVPA